MASDRAPAALPIHPSPPSRPTTHGWRSSTRGRTRRARGKLRRSRSPDAPLYFAPISLATEPLSRLATLAPQGTIERLQADEYGRNRGAVVEIWNLVHVEHKNELLELGAPAHAEVA